MCLTVNFIYLIIYSSVVGSHMSPGPQALDLAVLSLSVMVGLQASPPHVVLTTECCLFDPPGKPHPSLDQAQSTVCFPY